MLRGRSAELAALDRVLSQARDGRGAALVVRGEVGAGKTALLESAASSAAAAGARLLRGAGVESEAELPYAGLQVVLREVLGLIGRLPARQAEALRTAADPAAGRAEGRGLGTGAGSGNGAVADVGGDRFLVGAATLTLLGELAGDRPVVVLVDDAHWLDHESAEALVFAARRLGAERVAIVFAARGGSGPAVFGAPGLPVLPLDPLPDEDGSALLADLAPALHASVRHRVLAQAQGNPLALVELAGALTAGQRDGSEPVSDQEIAVLPASWRVQRIFDDRIRELPGPTQALLTAAAAEDTGDLALIVRAGAGMGAAAADLAPAEEAGLIRLAGGRVVFRHPLVRAAVYQGAGMSRRMAAHRALAEALLPTGVDAEADAGAGAGAGEGAHVAAGAGAAGAAGAAGDRAGGGDRAGRRAWHLAAAAVGYDEDVAGELERTAEHFRSRGGRAAVAAAYRRAAQLTEDPGRRARRLAAAALAAGDAGQTEHAAALADAAAGRTASPDETARLASLRAGLAHTAGRPEAARLVLLDAARQVAGRDPAAGSRMAFEAMAAAWDAPDPAGAAADTLARLAGLDLGDGPLVRGTAALHGLATGDLAGGTAALREFADHVAATRRDRELPDQAVLQGWDMLLGDYAAVHDQAAALDRECREHGAVGVLPRVLLRLARCRLFLGRHRDAYATAVEGLEIARDTGHRHYGAMLGAVLAVLAALDGDEPGCLDPVPGDLAPGSTPNPLWHAYARGLLDLGRGRYEPALHRFAAITSGPNRHVLIALHALPEQVEAAVRLGRPAGARDCADRFARWAAAVRTPWAQAVELRCRALLAPDDEEAAPLYERALAAHAGDGRPFEEARTRLLYGERLRRARRRGAARDALAAALESFERLHAAPWADRARSELRAAGASGAGRAAAPAGADPAARLTAQELQVARLAATGLSNREIGARLFISPRTVGYHLSNAYPKLGVTSRAALAGLDLTRPS
ncbi:LuxR family transcriptional regulator [Streptomyces sp. NPDC046876]|uniref:helix-turn-helix transcriptional regulator n=1 Tax=Streptomyces sp. NPDC046876 TaxID=3155616 RepID=UPI0033EF8622